MPLLPDVPYNVPAEPNDFQLNHNHEFQIVGFDTMTRGLGLIRLICFGCLSHTTAVVTMLPHQYSVSLDPAQIYNFPPPNIVLPPGPGSKPPSKLGDNQ